MTSTNPSITLSAINLCRNFGKLKAAQAINIELKRGQVLGLLGSNGAGKTTTMRMLTGNLAPHAGSLEICGVDLLDQPQKAKAHIGYLPETPPLYQEMTVDEYLKLAAKLHRICHKKIEASLDKAKQRCGLSHKNRHLIHTLSKGYQQRVGIAQAIIHEPDVIILDEPTVGLDPHQIAEVRTLIRELGMAYSVILSTHNLHEIENLCTHVQILHQGKTVFNCPYNELNQQTDSLEETFLKLTSNSKQTNQ